jgi:hypothetical protein
MQLPQELDPNSPNWYYHDVYINEGTVYDPLSRYGATPVPFDEWIDFWDPEVPTHLIRNPE